MYRENRHYASVGQAVSWKVACGQHAKDDRTRGEDHALLNINTVPTKVRPRDKRAKAIEVHLVAGAVMLFLFYY
jgi:hypothetical protein